MNAGTPVLLIGRREVAERLDLEDCIEVVERAFQRLGEGKAPASAALAFPVEGGGFHVKAGLLDLGTPYLAVKTNANFPGNPRERNLPTIQGVILIADAVDGRPLAVLDSIEITLRRTAAATAVAACHLARPRSRTVTICGCGAQAPMQLRALMRVLPLRKAFAFDRDRARAERFARELAPALDLAIEAVTDLRAAARASDVCVTCTTATEFVLGPDDVREGTFIAAVGADSPDKREIHPELMSRCRVVVDDLPQCSTIGDLHHALVARAMTAAQVHAELGAVVAGLRPGRTSDVEITLFDSTGIALEDAAAASLVYERARAGGECLAVCLAD